MSPDYKKRLDPLLRGCVYHLAEQSSEMKKKVGASYLAFKEDRVIIFPLLAGMF